jgi:hypothetical protein
VLRGTKIFLITSRARDKFEEDKKVCVFPLFKALDDRDQIVSQEPKNCP